MLKVFEIPILSASDQVLDLLVPEQEVETLKDWPEVRYIRLRFDEYQVILYLLKQPWPTDDFAFSDMVIPKAPFTWILIEKDDLTFDKILKNYVSRYLTPYYFLTSNELKSQALSERISEDQLLTFDPEDPHRLRDTLLKTMKIRLVEEK